MNPATFAIPTHGQLLHIGGEPGADWAYVPAPLPPDWHWPETLWPPLMEARIALASLSGTGSNLPNPQILIRPLLQREAVRSSSLEGTFTPPHQQALFDLEPNTAEIRGETGDDFREIANYRNALQSYYEAADPLPVSLRLIRNLHRMLMESVRGADKNPGEFRRVQVHIGRPPRFVPPPPHLVPEGMDALERYLYAQTPFDPLVDAFLAHYQFEAIHPFRDGNGRVGRLLLSILITERCGMSAPWLQMSAYFDANRDEYLDRLLLVSTQNDWAGWIQFCLRGVVLQAKDAEQRCRRLLMLRQETQERLIHIKGSNRLAPLVDRLFGTPALTVPWVARTLGISYPTAQKDVEKLVSIGFLQEGLERRQPKAYYAPSVLEIVSD